MLFISVFQTVFGQENNIVGVILTILMASSMMRDLTSTPLKHLVIQSSVFGGYGGFCLFGSDS